MIAVGQMSLRDVKADLKKEQVSHAPEKDGKDVPSAPNESKYLM